MLRRAAFVFSLAAVLTTPRLASAQAAPVELREIVLAARGGFGGHGGVRAAPRFGSVGRFGHAPFRRFPHRRFPAFPHRFHPFIGFGFAFPLYVPYYAPDYYSAYCDPASVYYYPPWCYYW
jgi:hypothetical protein